MSPGNAGLDSTFNHHGKGFLVGFMADTGFQQLLDGWLDATWTMLVIFLYPGNVLTHRAASLGCLLVELQA